MNRWLVELGPTRSFKLRCTKALSCPIQAAVDIILQSSHYDLILSSCKLLVNLTAQPCV